MRYRFTHWLAGYNKSLIDRYGIDENGNKDDPSLAKLNVIGISVGLACALVPINWAIGSSTWTIGQDLIFRIVVSALAALFGLLLILTIDRSIIFAMDVNRNDSTARWYIILRMLMVLGVGLFTSEQVIPFVMRPQLVQQAAESSERFREQTDKNDYKQSNIDGWKALYESASRLKEDAKSALDLDEALLSSRQRLYAVCRRANPRRLAECASRLTAIRQAQKARNESKDRYDKAYQKTLEADGRLASATTLVDKLRDRSAKERVFVDENRTVSMTELVVLINKSWEFKLQFGIVLFILMMIEIMPMLTKLMIGRSNIGNAIFIEDRARNISIGKIEDRLNADAAMSKVISQLYVYALGRDEIQQRTIEELRDDIPPYIKSHLVIRMYDDIMSQLKRTIIREVDDDFDYRSGGALIEGLFSKLLNSIQRLWK